MHLGPGQRLCGSDDPSIWHSYRRGHAVCTCPHAALQGPKGVADGSQKLRNRACGDTLTYRAAVDGSNVTVQALMSGNHPVVAANHTVILNWNRETIPLLQQIAICQLERGSSAFQGCAPSRC